MLAFVVVSSKPGRGVHGPLLRRLRAEQCDAVPFVSEEHLLWTNPQQTVAFAGWQARTDILEVGSHWCGRTGGVTAFTGHPWPRGGAWRAGAGSWAEQLDALWRPDGPTTAGQPLDGVYAAAWLDPDGAGRIVNDALSVGMIYRSEDDDVVVFSSRAALAAWAVTPDGREPTRDAFGAGWLAFGGNMVDRRTGFATVRVLPLGSRVEVHPQRGARVVADDPSPWFRREPLPVDPDELFDLVHRDLRTRIESIARLPLDRPFADLTGGKDSRLMLALMLEAGVADRFRFRTIGAEGAPDPVVAAELAHDVGIAHTAVPPPPMGEDLFVQRLRTSAYQTSGTVGAWDMAGGTGLMPQPRLTGLFAECLKTNTGAFPLVDTMEGLRTAVAQRWRPDACRMLRPEVRRAYQARFEEELYERVDDAASTPQDRLDTFHLRHRLRRWTGALEELGLASRLYPLYSLVGTQAAFTLGPEARRGGLLHLEVMRRTGTDLAQRRFANDGWPEGVLAHVEDPEAYRRAPVTAPRGLQPRWQVDRLAARRVVVEEYLMDDPRNPVFDILDRRAVEGYLAGAEMASHAERYQVYGALAAAVWLGGHELVAKIGAPSRGQGAAVPLRTRLDPPPASPSPTAVGAPSSSPTAVATPSSSPTAVATPSAPPGPRRTSQVRRWVRGHTPEPLVAPARRALGVLRAVRDRLG